MNADSALRRRPSAHMVQLDGLRAIAVMGVLWEHFGSGTITRYLLPGTLGVRLFFVLSGFLITGILLDARADAATKQVSVRRVLFAFYARRVLRIFPLFYLVLLLCAVVDIPSVRQLFWWHCAYMTNVLMAITADYPPALSHFWSLAVEEQFYLLWPAIVLLVPGKWLGVTILGTFMMGPATRLVAALMTQEVLSSTMLMPECLDSLGAGAFAAYARRSDKWTDVAWRRAVSSALVAGCLLGVAWYVLRFVQVGWVEKIVLRDLSYALICLFVVDRASSGWGGVAQRILESRPLVFVGMISYGIYIWHDVLPLLDRELLDGAVMRTLHVESRGMAQCSVVFLFSLLASTLSWYVLERPINRLKSRFPYVVAAQ